MIVHRACENCQRCLTVIDWRTTLIHDVYGHWRLIEFHSHRKPSDNWTFSTRRAGLPAWSLKNANWNPESVIRLTRVWPQAEATNFVKAVLDA